MDTTADLKKEYPLAFHEIYKTGYNQGLMMGRKEGNTMDQGKIEVLDTVQNGNSISASDVERRARSMWDADAGLREEFSDLETWLAFSKAEAEGRIRIVGGRLTT